MAALGAGPQLGEHLVIDAVLGIDEALQIERVHASTLPLHSRDLSVIDARSKLLACWTSRVQRVS
ncbi:hypothetical protein GCM10010533_31800 [Mycolicibacterium pallens]